MSTEKDKEYSEIHSSLKEEILLLNNKIDRYADKMGTVADKLDDIVDGLKEVVKSHNAVKSTVDGYGATIKRHGDEIIDLQNQKVSKSDFTPVRSIVYGAVGIILVAVFSALVYLVIIK